MIREPEYDSDLEKIALLQRQIDEIRDSKRPRLNSTPSNLNTLDLVLPSSHAALPVAIPTPKATYNGISPTPTTSHRDVLPTPKINESVKKGTRGKSLVSKYQFTLLQQRAVIDTVDEFKDYLKNDKNVAETCNRVGCKLFAQIDPTLNLNVLIT